MSVGSTASPVRWLGCVCAWAVRYTSKQIAYINLNKSLFTFHTLHTCIQYGVVVATTFIDDSVLAYYFVVFVYFCFSLSFYLPFMCWACHFNTTNNNRDDSIPTKYLANSKTATLVAVNNEWIIYYNYTHVRHLCYVLTVICSPYAVFVGSVYY